MGAKSASTKQSTCAETAVNKMSRHERCPQMSLNESYSGISHYTCPNTP